MGKKKLLVTGGNGFVGSEICRIAITMGHDVISISRRGRPDISENWTDRVQWISADIFDYKKWQKYLHECNAVVHTIGILIQYKKKGITYEKFNRDSTILTAQLTLNAGIKSFVFLSASFAPFFFKSYLTAKRDAETHIQSMNLRSVILRPGVIYGSRRPMSILISMLMKIGLVIPLMKNYIETYYPLPIKSIARAAVLSAFNEDISGVLDIDLIKNLSER